MLCLSPSSSEGGNVVQKSTTVQDSAKLQELQSTIQSLQEEAELQRKQHSDLLASFEEAERQKAKLEREKEEATAENTELLQNYSRLQKSVNELQARVQEQEGKSMLKAQHDNEIQTLKKALAGIENTRNCVWSNHMFLDGKIHKLLSHICYIFVFYF